MAQVLVIRDADKDWREVSPDWPGRHKPGEPKVVFKVLMDRDQAGLPNMQRTCYEPHHFEPPHSHAEDEVLYLLGGELAFGDQALGAGDALYVPRNTRYSLRAGEAGCEFVRVGLPTAP